MEETLSLCNALVRFFQTTKGVGNRKTLLPPKTPVLRNVVGKAKKKAGLPFCSDELQCGILALAAGSGNGNHTAELRHVVNEPSTGP